MQRPVLITVAVLLGGCATLRPQPQPQPGPADATLAAHGIECHKERATGSLVAATVCTSAAERARAAENVQETRDWMNGAKAGPCPPNVQCN
jgi:uncharacterized protein YceK